MSVSAEARLFRCKTEDRGRRLALLPLLACTAACPVPITHTETLSPPVVGVVHHSDGTPIVGALVGVAYGYSRSPCAEATSQATTDSAGVFRLEAKQKDYRVVWVIPNLDRFPPGYLLCVGTGDTLRPAYAGRGSLDASAPADSVDCVEWLWQERTRVTCTGKASRAVVEGGRWSDSAGSGWYRLILTSEDSGRRPRPLAVVQWLERSSADAPVTVRSTAELPFPPEVQWAADPALGEIYGRWCASIVTDRKTAFGFKRDWLRFTLGPPGQTHPVQRC